MTAGNNKNNNKMTVEKWILIIAIVAPIVIAFLITGIPVIWKGLVVIFKTVIPNIWGFLFNLYIAIIAFAIGRITKK